MREQVAARDARLAGAGPTTGRTGVVAVAAGEGMQRLFAELGAIVVHGGETLNPSTYELLAGSTASPPRKSSSCPAPPTS